jgi:hypothetical protein
VTVTLLVLTTKTTVTGKGKHRKSVQRTVVAYQLVSRGIADAQGRLTRTLHVTYTPSKPVQAGLTVTASTANGSAARTGHVTITPRHALALVVAALARRVVSGHMLVLHLHTAAHAHVVATLQVVATKIVVSGKGKHRKRVTHTVVLYQVTLHGVADARGRFVGRLRVGYRPRKATLATVNVTARSTHDTAQRSARITIVPLR